MILTAENAAQAQTFTDTTFNNADWSGLQLLVPGSVGTSYTAAKDISNGIGSPSRSTVHNLIGGTTGNPSVVIVAHRSPSSSYDPATQGAIVKLSYSYDLRQYLPIAGQAVAYSILIFQNNTYYRSIPVDSIFLDSWQPFGSQNLTASNFTKVFGPSSNAQPDFSCAGSKIEFGYVTANSNPSSANPSIRTSGIDNWKVSIDEKKPCCGTISATKKPTCDKGVFTYTFTVTNNSSQAIQYLLLSPPAGATFSIAPNTINLGANPLNPGQSTTVSVAITNASPGDHVCINVSLADKNVVTCCTIQTCFDLPDCPCLKSLTDKIVCGANGTYSYSVTLQNLTSVPVQQIFIVSTQPSNLNISPQLVTFSTPLQPNQSTTITLTITGAPPGASVCLRFSPLSDNSATCCSVEKCFTLVILKSDSPENSVKVAERLKRADLKRAEPTPSPVRCVVGSFARSHTWTGIGTLKLPLVQTKELLRTFLITLKISSTNVRFPASNDTVDVMLTPA